VTETIPSAGNQKTAAPAKTKKSSGGSSRGPSGGLSGKVLAELQQIAAELGIKGTARMRKSDLIEAIKAARGEATDTQKPAETQSAEKQPASNKRAADKQSQNKSTEQKQVDGKQVDGQGPGDKGSDGQPNKPADAKPAQDKGGQQADQNKNGDQNKNADHDKNTDQDKNTGQPAKARSDQKPDHKNGKNNTEVKPASKSGDHDRQRSDDRQDDHSGGRRNRRNRNRGRGRGPDSEPVIREDDVLVPAAGIVDILDNYAFIRTTGYLPSENDVYVSMAMVRKCGLRKGDAVVGQVRQPREGERKEKFNPLVRVDSINGMMLDDSKSRIDFSKLTPLYPSERLRLEGEYGGMAGRVIDLVSPIGKGQRGLIVSPPKAGKTMIMQQIANAITENNPECHLMIVLVDERPEEVTDFQRTVKGEVISSTFDRPASDHTTVAELAIERAKRLVELDHDVVVLLDGITRLGRAYNLAAPASGRIMSGGVDSSALYPPKKFFGAARNIEDGGSLTILATALVETGSRMDEVIFEEFKGTGNMELRLRRELADKRIFPAIDVDASSTRREELLMPKDELMIVWKLRRVLSGLDSQQGIELVLDKLKQSKNNPEFLRQISTTMPSVEG